MDPASLWLALILLTWPGERPAQDFDPGYPVRRIDRVAAGGFAVVWNDGRSGTAAISRSAGVVELSTTTGVVRVDEAALAPGLGAALAVVLDDRAAAKTMGSARSFSATVATASGPQRVSVYLMRRKRSGQWITDLDIGGLRGLAPEVCRMGCTVVTATAAAHVKP